MMSFSEAFLMKEYSKVYLVTVIQGLSLSDPFTLLAFLVFCSMLQAQVRENSL